MGGGDEIEELVSDDLLTLNVLHEREELMDPILSFLNKIFLNLKK